MRSAYWSRVSRMFPLFLAAALLSACAQTPTRPAAVGASEQDQMVANARATFDDFMRDPDQTWLHDNIDRAKAVLIAPRVVKAGFIFGGSGGRAVLVSRDGRRWVGPAFYDLATASVGFQAGAEVSQVVVLVMTDRGLNSLLSNAVKLGAGASIAAGPIGAGAHTNITADMVAFSRSKGVYGGVNLAGTVVHPSQEWNDAFYNRGNVLPTDILISHSVSSPKAVPLLADIARATRVG